MSEGVNSYLESVAIRRMEQEDIERLRALRERAYLSAYGLKTSGEGSFARVDRRKVYAYVAETDQLFGYVIAGEPEEDMLDDSQSGEIIDLCIDPVVWRKGYGRKLLIHGVSILRRKNLDRAVIWVRCESEGAMQLVTGLGFEPLGMQRITNDRSLNGLPTISEDCFALDIKTYF